MTNTNLNTYLLMGLAAFGISLAIAGINLLRRRQVPVETSFPEEMNGPTGAGSDASAPMHSQFTGVDQPSAPIRPISPLIYFALVFALTIPLWVFGSRPAPIPVKLPYSALGLVVPLVAAVILTSIRGGASAVKALFSRVFDYQKIKGWKWYLPMVVLPLFLAILVYAVMRLAGLPLPDPRIPWLMIPVYILVFFVAGIFEELGWMGYAFDPLQDRWGALRASLLLGVVWAVIHVIPDLQNQQPLSWILWQRLGTILLRILMVWIYNNNGKSVFAMILFHAANNLAWALFPNNGSHYDPAITFMLYLPVVIFVVTGWDAKTLTHYRFSRTGRLADVPGHNRVVS